MFQKSKLSKSFLVFHHSYQASTCAFMQIIQRKFLGVQTFTHHNECLHWSKGLSQQLLQKGPAFQLPLSCRIMFGTESLSTQQKKVKQIRLLSCVYYFMFRSLKRTSNVVVKFVKTSESCNARNHKQQQGCKRIWASSQLRGDEIFGTEKGISVSQPGNVAINSKRATKLTFPSVASSANHELRGINLSSKSHRNNCSNT